MWLNHSRSNSMQFSHISFSYTPTITETIVIVHYLQDTLLICLWNRWFHINDPHYPEFQLLPAITYSYSRLPLYMTSFGAKVHNFEPLFTSLSLDLILTWVLECEHILQVLFPPWFTIPELHHHRNYPKPRHQNHLVQPYNDLRLGKSNSLIHYSNNIYKRSNKLQEINSKSSQRTFLKRDSTKV
jgi:hypothetical protein